MVRENNLLIIGAGQYGCVVKETAQAVGCYNKIEFIDDNSKQALGKIDELENFFDDYANAFVAIGNSKIRLELIEKIEVMGYRIITLVHPKAYVSRSSTIEKGCVIEPNAVVHSNVSVGSGCLISANAVVNHNAIVGDGCHIDCNATVTARSIVKAGTKIECGQVYKNEVGHV